MLPPSYLDAVVAIGVDTTDESDPFQGSPVWIATGFLVGRPLEDDIAPAGSYHVFLVTNRHVFEELEDAGKTSFLVRFNPGNAATNLAKQALGFRLELIENGKRLWTQHPVEDVAVKDLNAAMLQAYERRFRCFLIGEELVNVAQIRKEGISEGDSVYLLGYPLGNVIVDRDRHYTIVRSGTIARIRDVFEGRRSHFLLDVQNFPGNSGGPVVLKPEAISIAGIPSIRQPYIIGIARAYLPSEDARVSPYTGKKYDSIFENSGLAVAVTSDCIMQTIEDHFNTFLKDAGPKFTFEPGTSVVASLNTHIYHEATCPVGSRILPPRRLWFVNAEAAEKAGCRPCTKCRPN